MKRKSKGILNVRVDSNIWLEVIGKPVNEDEVRKILNDLEKEFQDKVHRTLKRKYKDYHLEEYSSESEGFEVHKAKSGQNDAPKCEN